MTEERHDERTNERQAERDSQLSAMFDGELPAAECELLARRLARDEALRAQWSRYSMIGAALRAERGVALHDRVAWRVQSAVAQETTYGDQASVDAPRPAAAAPAAKSSGQRWARFGYPVAGASIAAGVAAVSILWLQGAQEPVLDTLQASTTSPTTIVLTPEPAGTTVAVNTGAAQGAGPSASAEDDLYSTPAPSSSTSLASPARFANYVVAHSEYSGPLTRRMALLGVVGAESESAPEDVDAP